MKYRLNLEQIPSPQDFVTETPPYTELVFPSTDGLLQIEFFQGTVDTYCPSCGHDTVYKRRFNPPDGLIEGTWINNYDVQNLLNGEVIRFNIQWKDTVFGPVGTVEYSDFLTNNRLITMDFECSRVRDHHLHVFAMVKDQTLTKIGQHPSLADLQKIGARRYRKVLGESYPEFARAIGLSAHGVGIGAYVYLRRIFENLLEEARKAAEKTENWDESLYRQSRVTDRIELLHAYLPKFLVENKGVYGILSKGIHELNEDECLQYFSVVRVAIELILDERIQAIEKEKKTKLASKQIAEITGELSSPSNLKDSAPEDRVEG